MALEQAEWAVMMGTPCEFRLLNPGPAPLREGIDFARIDTSSGGVDTSSGSQPDTQAQVDALRSMLERITPHGPTPIADRLNEVHARIKQDHAELVSRGQRVVVVLATDGCPTLPGSGGKSTTEDKRRVVQCIKRLTTELPVFMVVRLACDEDDVINFYNDVDAEVELNLEVIDDIEGEAKEIVANGNGWLTYTPMLHRIREGGTFLKLLDILDERPLTPVEIVLLSQLLLRPADEDSNSFRAKALASGLSHDSEKLLMVLEEYNKEAALVYHPVQNRMAKPINIAKVRWAVLPTFSYYKLGFMELVNAMAPVVDAIVPMCDTQKCNGYTATNESKVETPSVRNISFMQSTMDETISRTWNQNGTSEWITDSGDRIILSGVYDFHGYAM